MRDAAHREYSTMKDLRVAEERELAAVRRPDDAREALAGGDPDLGVHSEVPEGLDSLSVNCSIVHERWRI